MKAVSTNRLSTSTASDFWLALATAERTTFSISPVARLFVNFSVISASLTFFPRIMSTTSRAFWGDILINRPEALLIKRPPLCLRSSRGAGRRGRGGTDSLILRTAGAVSLEHPSGRELAELVPDHVLGHIHRDEFLAVVNRDRVPDHFGRNRRAPRPRLVNLALAGRIHVRNGLQKRRVNEGSLFD